MVLNVIEPVQTRYIPLAEDLEKFLRAKYEQEYPSYEFNVEHVCDRWTFEAPEKIEEEEITRLIEEIEENVKAINTE
ncbi:uncharacterized protein K460DRAFT_402234 [Cucurbitaria berberidis CBS 394.84]|uniref:Uncharacterized protein n=1 Tax=Cucurbitaria berberidis CBS 394.84 TaxID=1168544 RepID=A0A9P4GKH3_9PLEO|nr:uncharacterized protein K460DRAFT_402234 [Cucurbitaria berberidis CBS 394.84]KAF1846864.1 hypothetical protein K460DRAFT_402234 [Cucurbitaria berberidis CBS 394.84]